METTITGPKRLAGEIRVPGDKSISHRSVILNAIATGTSTVKGFSDGEDCASTVRAMQMLGASVEKDSSGTIRVVGTGTNGLREPETVLNVGNSGTTARLLCGVLAGRDMLAVIYGDKSICSRPMDRVIKPLRLMGATIWGRKRGTLAPIVLYGGELVGMKHEIRVASAQVKSALLLAGLRADGTTEIVQPAVSRDHTEKMLKAMGARLEASSDATNKTVVKISPTELHAVDVDIPGDISSAAFWLVAALVHPNAEITVRNVGLNPTRIGIFEAFKRMGADITIENRNSSAGELYGDVTARSSSLKGCRIDGPLIPLLIDEIPILATAAAFAEGDTEVSDAEELRGKETDRISATAEWLNEAGVPCHEKKDGMIISGRGCVKGGTYDSFGDHRIAMSLAVAGLAAAGPIKVKNSDSASVSYCDFWAHAEQVGAVLQ